MLGVSAGCSLMPTSGTATQLTVENRTESDARMRVVEYDFVGGIEGEALGDAFAPLGPGRSVTVDMPTPNVDSWAIMVNDLVAVTSFGLAESEANLPGLGPLVVHVAIHPGQLNMSTSRRGDQAGEASPP